jgi:hypothetical protein
MSIRTASQTRAFEVGGSVAQTVAIRGDTAAYSKQKRRLLEIIRKNSLLTTGGPFKLASGATSAYYLDMKPTTFDPEGANLIADIALGMMSDESDVEAIGGLEVGSVPIIVSSPARGGSIRHKSIGAPATFRSNLGSRWRRS